VQVGYVVENPIWKTSYRLVLGKNGKPFLQGWAIVENTSDDDWSGVRMALISGRPISFQMDLYQPLYVPRPVVEPELFASLRPPTYTGAMTGKLNLANDEIGADGDKPTNYNVAGIGGRNLKGRSGSTKGVSVPGPVNPNQAVGFGGGARTSDIE